MPDPTPNSNVALDKGTPLRPGAATKAGAKTLVKTTQVKPRSPGRRATDTTSKGMLQQQLLQAISTSQTRDEALTGMLRVITDASTPVGLLYFSRNDEGLLAPQSQLSPAGTGNVQSTYHEPLKALGDKACEKGAHQVARLDAKGRLIAVAVPVMLRGQAPESIGAIYAGGNIDQALGVLQVVAAHVTLWQVLQVTKAAEFESKNTAALLELLGRCDSSASLQQAGITLVNELKDYLNCDQVALGLCGVSTKSCRLQAVSGMSQFDKRSEFASAMESALDESIVRDELTIWPAGHEGQQDATLAHRRVCELNGHASVVSSPLYDDQDNLVGAWMFFGDEKNLQSGDLIDFADASQRQVGATLQLLQRAEMNPISWTVRTARTKLSTRKAKFAVAMFCLCCLALCLPVKYRVGCECRVQPVVRRFVAAPYDGKLDKTLVEPGDTVSENQLLARLDGRELRWELAGLEAELNRAEKTRDAAMAIDHVAEAQQAGLEVERLRLKTELLQSRLENLEVRSPLDGIVISGDLKKTEGAPLSVGQIMFEVSPLDRMIVEVEIPEREILHVRAGMEVVFRVDAYPGRKWSGTIERIFPRAELRENESVYLAEVNLNNESGELRPGMKGRARTVGERHALGWNLFHKPYESLCMLMGV